MEQSSWPSHERTKDLVQDQSPGSAGNQGYLTQYTIRNRVGVKMTGERGVEERRPL